MTHKSATTTVDLNKGLTAFERQVLFFEDLYKQPISQVKYKELLGAHFNKK